MMTREQSPSFRQMLDTVLHNAGVAERAEAVFIEWPELEQIAAHFLRFVSPWLMVDESSVAELTLHNAFAMADQNGAGGKVFPHRTFMEAITECAGLLASVRVSVLNEDNLWEIWSYDEPLMHWMEKKGRSAMQIRRRETPVERGPILIKMLAFISSTRDMQLAEITIDKPLEIFQK